MNMISERKGNRIVPRGRYTHRDRFWCIGERQLPEYDALESFKVGSLQPAWATQHH